ncbi:MAG TPA: hypothetical protein VNK04_06770 [Gemmataceae bacterium]|nr:hypothetical protein [Gemmataceae bacterium]
MPATILAIADAVVAELNGTTFSQPFTAERHYQPNFELSEMSELKVSVVPRSVASKSLDRNRDSFEYQIDVAVQKRTDMTPASLDALMTLVEEIADHFRTQPLANFTEARCTEVKNEPVYAIEHLDELRQFTSVLTLTFRVWR